MHIQRHTPCTQKKRGKKKRGEKKGGTKINEKLIITNLKKRILAYRAASKATRLFLTK